MRVPLRPHQREIAIAVALLLLAATARLATGEVRAPAGRPALAAGQPQLTTPHPLPEAPGYVAADALDGSRGIPCYGPGRGSKHFRIFYAHVENHPARLEALRVDLRADLAFTDEAVNASAQRTGGIRHLKLDTGPDCMVTITPVTLPAALGPTQIRELLAGTGALVGDEKGIVYADWMPNPARPVCGISELYEDDRPATQDNWNNRTSTVAMTFTACLLGGTTAHEVMHTLGAVQPSAPNATGAPPAGGYHCTDEWDRMCYADNGQTMSYPCPLADLQLFDCNGDDFFNVAPPAGSYLATHWNVANSAYLADVDPPAWDPTGGSPGPQPGAGGFDGNPATTERIDESHPVAAATAVSRARFAPAGDTGRTAGYAVLSRDDEFPDSLAGASLTAGGPLLLTGSSGLSSIALAELGRILEPGATVYLLGGEVALSPQVAEDVVSSGYQVTRLAGETRVETALAVADEVRRRHPLERRVAVARAYGLPGNPTAAWADAVTGGAVGAATGIPILVVPSEAVPAGVAAWLAAAAPTTTVLLGGIEALSGAVEAGVPNPLRVSGAERAATAAEIARTLWEPSTIRRYVLVHAGRPDGWAFGLAAAGLGADAGAPLLVVYDHVPGATAELIRTCGEPDVDLLLAGSASVISETVRATLEQLDGQGC